MKRHKNQDLRDTSTVALVCMLETLRIIKLQSHQVPFMEYAQYGYEEPKEAVKGMSTMSGSLYYTAEKYNS